MRTVPQPERPGPQHEDYIRPATWLLPAAKLHKEDGSGWDDPSGVRVWVQITDVTGGFFELTNTRLLNLAARQIHGGVAGLSKKPEHIGAQAAASNESIYLAQRKNRTKDFSEIQYAMVFEGVDSNELQNALHLIVGESERLRQTYGDSPQLTPDSLIFHQ